MRRTLAGASDDAPATITGTDGKTYALPAPPRPRDDTMHCEQCHELHPRNRVYGDGRCADCWAAAVTAPPTAARGS